MARAIERAGGRAEVTVIRNLKPEWAEDSAARLSQALDGAQMLILPGGFSVDGEPGGAGGYTVSFFKDPRVTEAIRALLARDGLILGIGSGFQALIRLGLLPYGDFRAQEEDGLALALNRIGRHQSRYVYTRVASVLSPWLSACEPGQVYRVPVSHGEGRFAAPVAWLERLRDSGQIAQQYCGADGAPGMDIGCNPNGSDWAVEAVSSPDGRVLGKMAHNERAGVHIAKNIPGNKRQPVFVGGVQYFL
jgi:phosphoribosylformylglycinamidine synthase